MPLLLELGIQTQAQKNIDTPLTPEKDTSYEIPQPSRKSYHSLLERLNGGNMGKKKQKEERGIVKHAQRGLPKNHKCNKCPMAYHNEFDLKLHMRHWHGEFEDENAEGKREQIHKKHGR